MENVKCHEAVTRVGRRAGRKPDAPAAARVWSLLSAAKRFRGKVECKTTSSAAIPISAATDSNCGRGARCEKGIHLQAGMRQAGPTYDGRERICRLEFQLDGRLTLASDLIGGKKRR